MQRVDPVAFVDELRRVNYVWLLPSAVCTLLGYVLRTVRWRVILSSAARAPLTTLFPVLINTLQGVRGVDPVLLATARTLGCSRLAATGAALFARKRARSARRCAYRRIGAHSALAACVGISGSTTIGKRCQIAGGVGISGHLTIGDDVVLTGFSVVTHSIPRPGVYSSSIPVEEAHTWRRLVARFKRIDRLATRLKKLEGAASAPHDQEEDDD